MHRAPNHPVYIQYLREGALLNSAALDGRSASPPKTPDPAGGKFERNPKTGELDRLAARRAALAIRLR